MPNMRDDIDALQEDVSQLKLAMSTFLGFEQVTAALSDIAEQLEPLRELRPVKYVTPSDIAEELTALRDSLARPDDWIGIEELVFPEPGVGSVSQVESSRQPFDDARRGEEGQS